MSPNLNLFLNLYFILIYLTWFHSWLVVSRPVEGDNNPVSTIAPDGPVATVDFLRKYGYLELGASDNNSEAIVSEESIRNGIVLMQKFGGLAQTGVMDENTRKLITTPRCGIPDVVRPKPSSNSSRSKRFVIGSKGWNKRSLTYSFQNWSPKLGMGDTMDEMEKAFNVWADYANLRFTRKPLNSNADIMISFGRGYHGDSYPFDGKGSILAHAFMPFEFSSLGGDIHFDEDEDWWSPNGDQKNRLANPIQFVYVAAHELGHSLGLAHSSQTDSIMFPYYKGEPGKTPTLGYDDILAMHQLYITRFIPQGEENSDGELDKGQGGNENDWDSDSSDRRRTTTTATTTTTKRPATWTSTTKRATVSRTTTERISTTTSSRSSRRPETIRTTTARSTSSGSHEDEESSKKDYDQLQRNLCNDLPRKITFLRNEIFVFRGPYMWRLASRGVPPPPAYPVQIGHLFSPLAHLQQIDAAYERDSDGNLIFFSGAQYWELQGTSMTSKSPNKPLTALGLPSSLKKLDAAFVWEKNKLTYFFSGDLYWRYNETSKRIDDGYPMDMERWGGVPTPIDSVLRWEDGKTYFFKDEEFWRFDDTNVYVEDNFPLTTKNYWLGC